MSNRNYLKQVVPSLISSDTGVRGCVVLLKGDWGVGKTYFWEKELLPLLNDLTPKKYISLFGCKSISEVKINLIIKSKLSKEVEKDKNKKPFFRRLSFVKQIPAILMGQKIDVYGLNISLDKFSSILDDFLPEKSIICIDDIERSAGELDLVELLALIHFLTETKKCNVLLITNEDVINESKERGTQYCRFKEKCVDYTFELRTDNKHVYKEFVSDYSKKEKELHEYLLNMEEAVTSKFINSKSKNLRTLNRVVRDMFYLYNEHNIKLNDEAASFLTMIRLEIEKKNTLKIEDYRDAKSFFDKSELDDPSLKLIKNYYPLSYEYVFNQYIFDFLNDGYCDFAEFKKTLEPNTSVSDARKLANELNDFDFWYTADDNKVKEVLDKFRALLKEQAIDNIHLFFDLMTRYEFLRKIIGYPQINNTEYTPFLKKCALDNQKVVSAIVAPELSSIVKEYKDYFYKTETDKKAIDLEAILKNKNSRDFAIFITASPYNIMLVHNKFMPEIKKIYSDKDGWFFIVSNFVLEESLKWQNSTECWPAIKRGLTELNTFLNDTIKKESDKMRLHNIEILLKQLSGIN